MTCCCGEAVDPDKIHLCCGCCCINCGFYTGCPGCSGKVGMLCCNCECCCKAGAPCLIPCGCCGLDWENGCSILNAQCQIFCLSVQAAIPCKEEVPPAISILGCTIFPKCGFCMPIKDVMSRD